MKMPKNVHFDKAGEMLKDLHIEKKLKALKKMKLRDAGIVAAFVAAIVILLLIAGYVITRLESDRIRRSKWHDMAEDEWI